MSRYGFFVSVELQLLLVAVACGGSSPRFGTLSKNVLSSMLKISSASVSFSEVGPSFFFCSFPFYYSFRSDFVGSVEATLESGNLNMRPPMSFSFCLFRAISSLSWPIYFMIAPRSGDSSSARKRALHKSSLARFTSPMPV